MIDNGGHDTFDQSDLGFAHYRVYDPAAARWLAEDRLGLAAWLSYVTEGTLVVMLRGQAMEWHLGRVFQLSGATLVQVSIRRAMNAACGWHGRSLHLG